MGFKLGKNRGFEATAGKIKTKMRFGKQAGNSDISVPGTPIIRMPLEDGVIVVADDLSTNAVVLDTGIVTCGAITVAAALS